MSSISGNIIVDEISKMNINSIPEQWYQNVRRSNQPHALAILVLWDLLYWYKWTEIRNEETGLVVGYKKKFRADLLQRSYSAIAEKFGITKRQATDVITFLEDIGVLKRVFRTIEVNGLKMSNVLFIALVPQKIKEISEIKTTDSRDSYNKETLYLSQNDVDTSHENTGHLSTQNRDTNTIISQSNTQSINSKSHCGEPQNTEKKVEKAKQSFPKDFYDKIYDAYFENCKNLYSQGKLLIEKPDVNYKKVNARVKEAFENYGFEKVLCAVQNSVEHQWLVENGYQISYIFGPNEITTLINKAYLPSSRNDSTEPGKRPQDLFYFKMKNDPRFNADIFRRNCKTWLLTRPEGEEYFKWQERMEVENAS